MAGSCNLRHASTGRCFLSSARRTPLRGFRGQEATWGGPTGRVRTAREPSGPVFHRRTFRRCVRLGDDGAARRRWIWGESATMSPAWTHGQKHRSSRHLARAARDQSHPRHIEFTADGHRRVKPTWQPARGPRQPAAASSPTRLRASRAATARSSSDRTPTTGIPSAPTMVRSGDCCASLRRV